LKLKFKLPTNCAGRKRGILGLFILSFVGGLLITSFFILNTEISTSGIKKYDRRVSLLAQPKAGIKNTDVKYLLSGFSNIDIGNLNSAYIISLPQSKYDTIRTSLESSNFFENVNLYSENPNGPIAGTDNTAINSKGNLVWYFYSDVKITNSILFYEQEYLSQTPAAIATAIPDSPDSLNFIDNTGKYGDKEAVIKEYLKSALLWRPRDIATLHNVVIIEDAAPTWTGATLFSYTSDNGVISNVGSTIFINAYLAKTDYDFKNVFSHEYGHHFTMFYIMNDKQILYDKPLPAQYYQLRPLDSSKIKSDYSAGWNYCDKEIIAEDYKYLFSPFKDHGAATVAGYPSDPASRKWIYELTGETFPEDKAAPTLEVLKPAQNEVIAGYYTSQISAIDNTGIKNVDLSLDGALKYSSKAGIFDYYFNTRDYKNGPHTFSVTACDIYNNCVSKNVDFVIHNDNSDDTLPPGVDILLPNDGDIITGKIEVKIKAWDNFKLRSVNIYIDDVALDMNQKRPFTAILDTRKLADGIHVIKAVAEDLRHNKGEAKITITTKNGVIDTEAPKITVESPVKQSHHKKSFYIRATATDNTMVTKMEAYLDGKLIVSASGDKLNIKIKRKIISLDQEKHVISIFAYDASGNKSYEEIDFTTIKHDNKKDNNFDKNWDKD